MVNQEFEQYRKSIVKLIKKQPANSNCWYGLHLIADMVKTQTGKFLDKVLTDGVAGKPVEMIKVFEELLKDIHKGKLK